MTSAILNFVFTGTGSIAERVLRDDVRLSSFMLKLKSVILATGA
jgi:hypothetical protein